MANAYKKTTFFILLPCTDIQQFLCIRSTVSRLPYHIHPFSGKSKTLARFSPCLGLCKSCRWIILDNLVPDNGPVVSVFCASHQCSRGLICKQQQQKKQQKEQKQQKQQRQQQQHQPVARHRIWCLCSCLCLWGRVGGCF